LNGRRLPTWVTELFEGTALKQRRLPLVLAMLTGAALAAILGAQYYPNVGKPSSDEAERQIAEIFQAGEAADERLTGDLLIERFYALEEGTGRRVVLDLCRGEIESVIVSLKGDWTDYVYSILLERDGLQQEREQLRALIRESADVETDQPGTYLGVWIQGGLTDLIGLNYDGTLPEEAVNFRGENGEGVFAFLSSLKPGSITYTRLINIEGTNFILTTADLSPPLKSMLGMQKAAILGQLLFVDRTSGEEAVVAR
jgi:hypothetical protein